MLKKYIDRLDPYERHELLRLCLGIGGLLGFMILGTISIALTSYIGGWAFGVLVIPIFCAALYVAHFIMSGDYERDEL